MASGKEDFHEKESDSRVITRSPSSEDMHHAEPRPNDVQEGIDLDRITTQHDEPGASTKTGGVTGVLSRVATARSAASYKDPGPPPDGGLVAWTQALMGHLCIMNTWGYINSFGVFQTYYTETLGVAQSDISWIGTSSVFMLFFIGTVSGRATDAGLFRPVYCTGVVISLIGIFMTSLCTRYWQLFLAQGVCTGIGNGLMFCPTMSLVATYFSKRRTSAIGIAAAGSATGGLIYPTMVRQLLPKLGFGWTVRVLGFVTLGTSLITIAFLRVRLPPRKSGPLVEFSAFKEATYAFFCVGMFLNFWGLYFAFYYISAFARDRIGMPYQDSLNLLLILNGVGYITRILPPYLSDRFTGPINMAIPFAFATGVMVFAWSGVKTEAGLYLFAVIIGLTSAGVQALFPAVLTSLTPDLKKTGVRMGMAFSIVSFACLTGPPLAGALIEDDGGSYLKAQMWGGTVLICGSLMLIAARIAQTGWKLRVKI